MGNTIRTRTRLGVGVTALSAAFLAGVAVATGVPGSDRATVDEPLRLANAALRPAASCEELRQWYVDRALDQVTAWGWVSPYPIYHSDVLDTVADVSVMGGVVMGGVPGSPALSPRDAVTSSRTGTNVQEAGVDEPDTVKTDGTLLVTVEGTRLTTYDVSGAAPELLASILLPGMQDAELLLSGDTVVAIGPDTSPSRRHPVLGGLGFGRGTQWHSDTRVTTVDVGDPAAPRIIDSRVFDAGTVGVRLHEEADGGVARLVLSAGLPDLPFVSARGGRRSQLDALERNRQVVRDTTIEDWLPSVRVGLDEAAAPVPAVDCADVALPDGSDSLGTVLVVAFPVDDPGAAESTAVVADTQTAYFSDDRLYLADSTSAGGWWGFPRPAPLPLPSPVAPPGLVAPDAPDGPDLEGPRRDEPGPGDSEVLPMPPLEPQPIRPIAPPTDTGTTRLYSFELDQTATRYVAAGEVEGSVRDRWAMDAVGGSLRLAVGPTVETGNYNSIVTLAEREGELVETGRVDALGVGEEIKSVRWFDDLVVLVTFRQVDPLYAVSLADPTRPRVLGELKIPGFSEYLHPIGADLLIGVGQDASWSGLPRGAQLGLFDLSDLTSPRRLDTVGFGRSTRAMAGLDPRQFTWLADRSTALTVVADDRDGTGDVVITRVVGDRLETRSTQVESGRDVTRVRLVPLPDGRVVLWTGSTVTFLDLG